MGDSKSKSSSSTRYTTTYNTTTTTTMRDVGLTGAQAVDLAAVIEMGGTQRHQLTADLLGGFVQATGNAWNTLIGGAGDFVETSRAVSENIVRESVDHGLDLAILGARAGERYAEAGGITGQALLEAGERYAETGARAGKQYVEAGERAGQTIVAAAKDVTQSDIKAFLPYLTAMVGIVGLIFVIRGKKRG